MGKRRPAVIVSNSTQNLALDSVVGVPLSSHPPEIPPLRVRGRFVTRRHAENHRRTTERERVLVKRRTR
jgi:mRNA-degrading endonuclease toxin of MazEF toxin-antitoxin module